MPASSGTQKSPLANAEGFFFAWMSDQASAPPLQRRYKVSDTLRDAATS